jgi:hypothetical protein
MSRHTHGPSPHQLKNAATLRRLIKEIEDVDRHWLPKLDPPLRHIIAEALGAAPAPPTARRRKGPRRG